MKVLFTILFNLKICLIFGQSFTYDGFIFGDRPKIVWTGLMKISKVGNGNFEIKLDRTLYNVKFDKLDQLYRYKGEGILPPRVFGGEDSNVAVEISCFTDLETFAIGIDINKHEYQEKYSIIILAKTNMAQTSKGNFIPHESSFYSEFMPWVNEERHISEWHKNILEKAITNENTKTPEYKDKRELITENIPTLIGQIKVFFDSFYDSLEKYFSSNTKKEIPSSTKQELIPKEKPEKKDFENASEMARYKNIVMNWNEAHKVNRVTLFSSIFANEVNFYHTLISNNEIIKKKIDLLKKFPDYKQSIIGEITTKKLDNDEVKCSFDKEVTINGKVTNYPSYLIL